MVFISSAAGNTTAWEAGLHGLMSGCIFSLGVKLMEWINIDDVLNMTGTFLIPGIFGGLLPGFVDDYYGVYWQGWKSGQVLGTQAVGTAVIMSWALFWSFIVFSVLRFFDLLILGKNLQRGGLSKMGITQKGYVPSIFLIR